MHPQKRVAVRCQKAALPHEHKVLLQKTVVRGKTSFWSPRWRAGDRSIDSGRGDFTLISSLINFRSTIYQNLTNLGQLAPNPGLRLLNKILESDARQEKDEFFEGDESSDCATLKRFLFPRSHRKPEFILNHYLTLFISTLW